MKTITKRTFLSIIAVIIASVALLTVSHSKLRGEAWVFKFIDGQYLSNTEGAVLSLEDEEINDIMAIFGDQINLDMIKIYPNTQIDDPVGVNVGNNIYFAETDYFAGRRYTNHMRAKLIHMIVHVWQYQNFDDRYFDLLINKESSIFHTGNEGEQYKYKLDPGIYFEDLNIEQQANLVEDYYWVKLLNQEPVYLLNQDFGIDKFIVNAERMIKHGIRDGKDVTDTRDILQDPSVLNQTDDNREGSIISKEPFESEKPTIISKEPFESEKPTSCRRVYTTVCE